MGGTAVMIQNDDTRDSIAPQIAMDATGTAIAVWMQSDFNGDNIWANRFDGASWGTAELVEADSAGTASSPQIAMDGTGKAVAVWYQGCLILDNIWANQFGF